MIRTPSWMSVSGINRRWAVWALFPLWLAACSDRDDEPEIDAKWARSQRILAAAYNEEGRREEALEVLGELIASPAMEAQDLLNAACVEIELVYVSGTGGAGVPGHLDQAEALGADPARLWYCRATMAHIKEDVPAARGHYLRALEYAPDDPASAYHLASVCRDMGDTNDAEIGFRVLLLRDPKELGSYYLSAEYALGSMLLRSKDPEARSEGRALRASFAQHLSLGWPRPKGSDVHRGTLGRVLPPEPMDRLLRESVVAGPLPWQKIADSLGSEAGRVLRARAADLDQDRRVDLVLLGERGAFVLKQDGQARFATTQLNTPGSSAEKWSGVETADLSDLGRRSILLWRESGSSLLLAPDDEGRWRTSGAELPGAHDAEFVDYDHDGDLDLLLATDAGIRVFRNDGLEADPASGAPEQIRLTEVTSELGLPVDPATAILAEDLDNDHDIDLLVATGNGVVAYSNLRRGRFEANEVPATARGIAGSPRLRDVDADGLPDIVFAHAVYRNLGEFRFERSSVALPAEGAFSIGDLGLSGQIDLVFRCGKETVIRFGSLLAEPGSEAVLPAPSFPDEPALVADVDGDGDLDLIGVSAGGGVDIWRSGLRPTSSCIRIVLEGTKDNRQGKGAVVEILSGDHYARQLYEGEPLSFGLPVTTTIDVVRVTWPNGVVQHAIRPDPGAPVVIVQELGLIGSCPFLYAFDGNEHRFVTDILGANPLGLPLAPGVFATPDHDELLRLGDEELKPLGGEYRLHITEELREATYLDQTELWVIDHSSDVEVHPEERFAPPPFPPRTIHAVRSPLPLEKAVDQDGVDWTEALRTDDGEHAVPFKPLRPQLLGLVTPHHFDLRLPEEARAAKRVRLLMRGWLHWTDASVNLAASHSPQVEIILPTLWVPDAEGRFHAEAPPMGFPAGKSKTMVIDVTDGINRDDLRLRISSTMRLYWDSIRVAVDDGDHPVTVTKLKPNRAELYYRGISAPSPPQRENQPERFDFDRLRVPPWDQHQGMMTRYGDVLALLDAPDDRFVIFSAGDAIDLRFRVEDAPPRQPGIGRTYLLLVEGWAKDNDPNTAEAGRIEPLPFHGMSGYPYRSDEHFPDDEEHRAWREEWNTRPGRRLVPDLRD